MEKMSFNKWLWFASILLVAGCAPKRPVDTSNPDASIQWLEYALKESTEKPTHPVKLRDIYSHAEALQNAYPEDARIASFKSKSGGLVRRIPEQVYRLSIPIDDFDSFKWALGKDDKIAGRFDEYIELFNRGPQWRELTLSTFPESLSVFMSQAVDRGYSDFFDKHADAFKASAYALTPPIQKTEFMARYLPFIALEAEKAITKKDHERIAFLINHTPGFEEMAQGGLITRKRLQALGDYVLYDLQDEALTKELLKHGFVFDQIDLGKIDMKSAFARGLKADPENAVRMAGLDQPGKPLNKTAARFLLSLPVDQLTNLHPQHVDEAISMCMEAGGTDPARKFIQLKASQKPLERADYIRLMTLALKYGDNTIYNLAKKHGGNISIQELDLGELAYNQRIFERYAPKFLDNIYETMEDIPQSDGITLGTIYRIFQSENQKAGLWIVKKYHDLVNDWPHVNDGHSLLMDVCRAGNLEVAKYLIERKRADIHEATRFTRSESTLFGNARAEEGKLTPIHFAAQSGNADLIEYLKSKGANINTQTYFGATPLMYAAGAGHVEAVAMLISLNANVNKQMNAEFSGQILEDGKMYPQLSTALKRAQSGRHTEIVELLEKAGAK